MMNISDVEPKNIIVEDLPTKSANEADTSTRCASCGIAEVDDIKLVPCDDCNLLKYCSDECQKQHKSHHEETCKERKAELRDEILFMQPESSHFGDCPICCLPLSIDPKKSALLSCCTKQICGGCALVNQNREIEGKLQRKCAFCRKYSPRTDEVNNEQFMKRIEANDPVAMCYMGGKKYIEGDFKSAFEYWTKATELGSVQAHYQLSIMYQLGQGVEIDKKKQVYHLEQAAIAGHAAARFNLGCMERDNRHAARAAKHFIIAAKLGCDESLESVKDLYKAGYVSKDDVAAALRGHQAAVDATKSPMRDEAAKLAIHPH
mmetsp:Transcript_21686/g.35776  ORF Transcript_21686/g.35776 Transcript_21686/m.35776 type:complete len:319 (-) Transcript_21686:981-1937(-)